ncbi:hypothetical protein DFQ27_004834 [Actinomortierella ambigua]|uniref:Uncharacterized protein n=1 Tax=Actinomortierella ambigua TaxID=1343610 RepID=A0A9P6QJX8_9FUNG|nr:hypothetical protein DFQ27_004834 [Actinomortierella ambigua]
MASFPRGSYPFAPRPFPAPQPTQQQQHQRPEHDLGQQQQHHAAHMAAPSHRPAQQPGAPMAHRHWEPQMFAPKGHEQVHFRPPPPSLRSTDYHNDQSLLEDQPDLALIPNRRAEITDVITDVIMQHILV